MLLTRQVIQLAIERNQVTLQVQSWYTNEQIANNWHWKTNIIVNILFDLSSSDWDVMAVLYWLNLNIRAIYIDQWSLSLMNVGECLWCGKGRICISFKNVFGEDGKFAWGKENCKPSTLFSNVIEFELFDWEK